METRKLKIIFILALLLSFLLGYQVQTFFKNNEVSEPNNLYQEITSTLENYYLYDIDDQEKQQAFIDQIQAVVDSYALSNEDPYTRLTTYHKDYVSQDQEQYVGLGLTVVFEQDFFRIIDIDINGPSYQKLYPNDLIIGIHQNENDILFKDLNQLQAQAYLAGNELETKTFIIKNPEDIKSYVDLTYQTILTPTAEGKIIDQNTAYIKINKFSSYIKDVTEGTAKVFNDTLNAFEATVLNDSQKTLIIDLRDNPGGALTALHNSNNPKLIPGILQQLLKKDMNLPLFSMVDYQNNQTNYYGNLSYEKPYDIKILINENSASASEVFAAALNTYGYELYGKPSYGKDVYQNTAYLATIDDYSYYLTYTEGHWYYQDGLSVKDQPLDVNEIDQMGYYNIKNMIFEKEVNYDEVSSTLTSYQQFLNTYFDLTGVDKIREDGYFDQKTLDYLNMYQRENDLEVTNKLDIITAHFIYDQLLVFQNDDQNDWQLQSLLDMIE